MIRVAVVMGKMHSGGKKNLVMEYYRNIDRSKIQFDFICDEDSNAIPRDEIEKLGGQVFVVSPYQNILKNMIQMYYLFNKNKYSIVHAYNNTLNIFPMLIARLTGITVRISESISMAHAGDKKTIIKNILKPFSIFFATHYMANGEACGKWQFGSKLYNNGKVSIFKTVINAEINSFNPTLRINTREEYGLKENIVIGHIGRLTAQKNPLFLIDIFNEILKRKSDAKLLLVGDGELKEQVLKRIEGLGISDSVLYLGRREDIVQFYNAMDCFLLPSLYEGLPVVGVEAECSGIPMFFSSNISKESSPCSDLGYFISLDKNADEWAEIILKETAKHINTRRSRAEEVKIAGFDSVTEAVKLQKMYEKIVNNG